MFGFRSMPSSATPWSWSASEHGVERSLGHVEAALEGVVAVHQNLGLDDGDHPRLLTQGRVARERVGIGPRSPDPSEGRGRSR